ncbi:MAG TPA: hypothetical protein VIH21_03070, partial [Dehalococcoidia bacterium]
EPFRLISLVPSIAQAAASEAADLVPESTQHLHVPVMSGFLDAIETGRPPLVPIEECRRSMELITGMYKSAMTGARVTFPIARDDPWYSSIPPEGFTLRPIG